MTYEEFEDIMFGDEYESVTDEQITEQSRWSTYFSRTFKHKDTGKFYTVKWESGSTESQDYRFDDCYHEMYEVKPVEKIVTVYEKI